MPMRLTIAGGSHTFLFHVVGEVAEAEYAYLQLQCPLDFQLLAVTQV